MLNKTRGRRIIGVVLVLCMILSTMSFGVFADNADEAGTSEAENGKVVFSCGFEDSSLILNSGQAGTSSYNETSPEKYQKNAYSITTADKHSGNQCLYVKATEDTTGFDNRIPFKVKLEKDKYYKVSGWFKHDTAAFENYKKNMTESVFYGDTTGLNWGMSENYNYATKKSTYISSGNGRNDYSDYKDVGGYTPDAKKRTNVSSGEWTKVETVVKAEKDLDYILYISNYGNINTTHPRFLFVDDIEVKEVQPTVTLNGMPEGGKIAVPKTGGTETTVIFGDSKDEGRLTKTYVDSETRLLYDDQEGVTLVLKSAPTGVTFDATTNKLTVAPGAEGGKAIISSTSRTGITAEHTIIIDKPTAPTAENVKISGKYAKGETLTGSYVYNDINGDAENGTTFKWYRASNADGSDKTEISVATDKSYKLTDGDIGKYIFFGVTPKTTAAPTDGAEVLSAATDKIGSELVDLIIVSGQSNSVSGKVADSETTGKNNKYVTTGEKKVYSYEYDWSYDSASKTGTVSNGELKDARYGAFGFMVPLGIKYNELTGRKTIMVSTGKNGAGINEFIDDGEVKKKAKAAYDSCVSAINTAGYTIDKKLAFWLQGEGNSGEQADSYSAKFEKLLTQWQADDQIGRLDMFGVLMNRAWIDTKQHNTSHDILMTGPRQVYYSLGLNDSAIYDNVKLISCITDSLITDEGVENYFSTTYGNEEEFKTNFGYDRPKTAAEILFGTGNNRGHYTAQGYNELGTNAAQNAVAYLKGETNPTGIKVFDETGTEVADNGTIDLSKWYACGAVYIYPLSAKTSDKLTCTITKGGQPYSNVVYEKSTGMFIQKDYDDTEGDVTAKFKCGALSKTVKLKLADRNSSHIYNWITSGSETDTEMYKESASSDNNYITYPYTSKIADGKLNTANYTLSFKDRIYLPMDAEWTISWKGNLSSNTHMSMPYAKYLFAGDEIAYANYEDAFRIEDNGIVFKRSTGSSEEYVAAAYFTELDTSYATPKYNQSDWSWHSDSFDTFASQTDEWSIKNKKEADGTYQMYFCLGDKEAAFRTWDNSNTNDYALKSYSEYNKVSSDSIVSSKGLKKIELSNLFSDVKTEGIEWIKIYVNSSKGFNMTPAVQDSKATISFTDADESFKVVAAKYDGSTLKNIKVIDVTSDDINKGEVTADLTDFDLKTGESVMFYAWEDMINMIPLGNAKSATKN